MHRKLHNALRIPVEDNLLPSNPQAPPCQENTPTPRASWMENDQLPCASLMNVIVYGSIPNTIVPRNTRNPHAPHVVNIECLANILDRSRLETSHTCNQLGNNKHMLEYQQNPRAISTARGNNRTPQASVRKSFIGCLDHRPITGTSCITTPPESFHYAKHFRKI